MTVIMETAVALDQPELQRTVVLSSPLAREVLKVPRFSSDLMDRFLYTTFRKAPQLPTPTAFDVAEAALAGRRRL